MSSHARGRFAELLVGTNDEFPLDEACLLISAGLGFEVDIPGSLDRLDELAGNILPPTFDGLLRDLFRSGRLRGNSEDYYRVSNSRLDLVLQTGLGIPITLAVVALEVGRRAGVPMWGVSMPGHFLVRDKVDPSVFADPFHGGRELTAVDCMRLHRAVTNDSTWSDDYLRPVSRRTIVVRILTNLKGLAERNGDLPMLLAIMKMRQAIQELVDLEGDEYKRLLARLN